MPTRTDRVKQLLFWRSASPSRGEDCSTLQLRVMSRSPTGTAVQLAVRQSQIDVIRHCRGKWRGSEGGSQLDAGPEQCASVGDERAGSQEVSLTLGVLSDRATVCRLLYCGATRLCSCAWLRVLCGRVEVPPKAVRSTPIRRYLIAT